MRRSTKITQARFVGRCGACPGLADLPEILRLTGLLAKRTNRTARRAGAKVPAAGASDAMTPAAASVQRSPGLPPGLCAILSAAAPS